MDTSGQPRGTEPHQERRLAALSGESQTLTEVGAVSPDQRVEVLKTVYQVRTDQLKTFKAVAATAAFGHGAVLMAAAGWLIKSNTLDALGLRVAGSFALLSLSFTTAVIVWSCRRAYRFCCNVVIQLDKAFQFWVPGAYIPNGPLYDFPEGWGSRRIGGDYFVALIAAIGVMWICVVAGLWIR